MTSTHYILSSLDTPTCLVVKNLHGEKRDLDYTTTEDESVATRFDAYSIASMTLITLEVLYPAVGALNIMPIPVINGERQYHPTLPL